MTDQDAGGLVKSIGDSRVPDRLYLRLESGESITVSPELVLKYRLSPGRELSAEELTELRGDASREGAKARALRVLSARPMSKAELKGRLRQKGESEEDADHVVELMERVGFLDDREYATQVVRWCAQKGYGRGRAVSELSRRRVPKEFWEEALQALPEPEDTLDRLVAKRLERGRDDTAIRKLTDALLRRGFAREEIRAAIRRFDENMELQEDDYE